MVTKYQKRLKKYDLDQPHSRKALRTVVNKLGDSSSRLQMPLLHPDHIKWAAIVLKDVAARFDEIAHQRSTNIQKILSAKTVLSLANDDLENFARDDIQYVEGLRFLSLDNH